VNATMWRWTVFLSRCRTRLQYLTMIPGAYRNWWAVPLPKFGVGVLLELRNGTRYLVRPRGGDLGVVNETAMGNPYLGSGHIGLSEDATVVDIGAHIGDFAVQIAKRCPRGTILAVEPIADHVRQMEIQLLLNHVSNVRCRRLALGAAEGFADVGDAGSRSRISCANGLPTERVRMTSLGRLLSEEGIEAVDLLKLDCEGAEWDILPAAEDVLPRVRQICMEFHCDRGWTPEKLAAWLRDRGYRVWHTRGPWNGLLWATRP
jgi:FkbM family methyltransferase